MNEWTHEAMEPVRNLIQSLKAKIPPLEMPKLTIRNKTARIPIVQGGMGVGISLSHLSSAVANQGGIGVIAANGIGLIEPDYFKDGRAANIRALRKEIRKAKAWTNGLIGVNIMAALQDFHQLLKTAIEEFADLVFLGAGLPIKNMPVPEIRKAGVLVVPIVSSARAAKLIFSMWKKLYHDVPDAVVVEGPEAGGHLGFKESDLENESSALETVVPEVVDLLKPYEEEFDRAVPVIAAGGVFTGEDIHRMMQLGAAGVQMGTRFAATDECDADIRFKEAVVSCAKEDIGIIKSPVGMPGRAVVNNFLRAAEVKKRRFTCPWQCLAGCRADEAYYCISLALNNARKGNLDRGFVFIGSNGYRVENISSVAELIKELREQYISSLIADIQQSITDKVHAFCREFRNELPVPVFQELRLTD